MLVRILKLWPNISERKRVPVFDSFGKHVVITNPYTNVAEPQYQDAPYEVGDILDIPAEAQVKNGLAVEVNPDGTVKYPLPKLTVDEMETISGRRYYKKLRDKYPTIEDWREYLKKRHEELLDDLANLSLLQIGDKFSDTLDRQNFLDSHTDAIRNSCKEQVRTATYHFVDDWLQQVKR